MPTGSQFRGEQRFYITLFSVRYTRSLRDAPNPSRSLLPHSSPTVQKNRGVGEKKLYLKVGWYRDLGGEFSSRGAFYHLPLQGVKLFLDSLDSEISEEFKLKTSGIHSLSIYVQITYS